MNTRKPSSARRDLALDEQLCFALYSTMIGINKAYRPLLKALELNQASLGAHANTASVAWNLGNVQKAMQQPRKAVQSYRQALEVAQALPADAVSLALREKALQALGDLHASLGEHDQAQAYLQQLSALPVDAAAQADVATRVQALLALAYSQEQQDRLQPAQQALDQAAPPQPLPPGLPPMP